MNYGNQVAENGRNKKRIVATKLLKMKEKKDATSTTFLHHFPNKLQVVSCYWFKFEPNTKIRP